MTRKMTKFESDIKKEVFKLAEKYGYKEIGVCGTLDPKWYKIHMQNPTPGLSVLFYNNEEK